MYRKVIHTEYYRPERTVLGAFGIIDTLECGHKVRNKGSAGDANFRKCRECTDMMAGYTRFSILGNVVTTWDPETKMPVRREMQKRTGKDVTVSIPDGRDPEYYMMRDQGHRLLDRRERNAR